jgi:putative IMPACT (imprinted ancient) family translation regulator
MPPKRPLSPSSSTAANEQANKDIHFSTRITDRSSSFIALFSPSIAPRTLQAHASVSSASHKILAYRLPASSGQTTLTSKGTQGSVLLETQSDEDGETAAGKRLELLLKAEDITGSVVVGRWFGGILLGPVRFRWIEQVAREAINAYKAGRKKAKIDSADEKMTPREITRERERLLKELPERDTNIVILRQLLAEKKEKIGVEDSKVTESPAKKGPTIAYASWKLDQLQAVEKARDATIEFLLRELDKTDEQEKEEEELDHIFQAAEKEIQGRETQKVGAGDGVGDGDGDGKGELQDGTDAISDIEVEKALKK